MKSWSDPRRASAYARLGGALYLVIIAIGALGQLLVKDRLVVAGDPAATAANIVAHQSLWRATIAGEVAYLACAVAVSWVLYLLLRRVNRELALLGAFFNLVSIAVEVAARGQLIATLLLLGNASYLSAFEPRQLQTLAYLALRMHDYGFGLSLIFFGVACVVFGELIRRSKFLPTTLGVLMEIAGACYLVNSFALLLAPPLARALLPAILLPPFVAELALCLWLLIRGVDASNWRARAALPSVP